MIRVYSFISVFLLLSLSACDTTKEANTANELQPKGNVRQAIISSEPGVYRSADPIGILEAVLKGDDGNNVHNGISILSLTVSAAKTILHSLNENDNLSIVTFTFRPLRDTDVSRGVRTSI